MLTKTSNHLNGNCKTMQLERQEIRNSFELKYMDDSSSSSSEESFNETDFSNEIRMPRKAYKSSAAVLGCERVANFNKKDDSVYAFISPTSMPSQEINTSHYKPGNINGNRNKASRSRKHRLQPFIEQKKLNVLVNHNQNHAFLPSSSSSDSSSDDGNPQLIDTYREKLSGKHRKSSFEDNHSDSDSDSLAESIYHQPPKAADREAASRLAKRLYNLEGFRMTDVAKQLGKRNDFSHLVGEEYATYFNFHNQRLDDGLRYFLQKFTLTGETQERERILHHFSRRFMQCNEHLQLESSENEDSLFICKTEDACHTLVCALMLLNTDLHGQGVMRRMTLTDFQNNLVNLNAGRDFPKNQLKDLYLSIKNDPIRWPLSENGLNGLVGLYCNPQVSQGIAVPSVNNGPINPMIGNSQISVPIISQSNGYPSFVNHQSLPSLPMPPPSPYWVHNSSVTSGLQNISPENISSIIPNPTALTQQFTVATPHTRKLFESGGQSPYLDIPAEVNAKEYMRGFLARKWIVDANGKKTSLGKRSWKLYFARLRDLVIYLYKDATVANQAARAEEQHLIQLQQFVHRQVLLQQQKNVFQTSSLNGEHSDKDSMTNGFNNFNDLNSHSHLEKSIPDVLVNGDTAFDEETSINADPDCSREISSTQMDTTEAKSYSDSNTFLPSAAMQLLNKEIQLNDDSHHSPPKSDSAFLPSNVLYVSALDDIQPPSPPEIPQPEAVIRIAHSLASKATDYRKRPNVFRLKTKEGAEYLFQVNDVKELELWVDKLNFVAGLLSAPPMPSSCCSIKEFHPPLLPNGYTKFNMREQLEDYQKRIWELNRELNEMKKNPPIGFDSPQTVVSKPSPPGSLISSLRRRKSLRSSSLSVKLERSSPEIIKSNLDPNSSEISNNSTTPLSESQQGSTSPADRMRLLSNLPDSATGSCSSIATVLSKGSANGQVCRSSNAMRRKDSNGSINQTILKARQEFDDRLLYYESEINRYRTYARLLESELVRLHHYHQQQQLLALRQVGLPSPIPGTFYSASTPSGQQRIFCPPNTSNPNPQTFSQQSQSPNSNTTLVQNPLFIQQSNNNEELQNVGSDLTCEATDDVADNLPVSGSIGVPVMGYNQMPTQMMRKCVRQSWKQYHHQQSILRATRQMQFSHIRPRNKMMPKIRSSDEPDELEKSDNVVSVEKIAAVTSVDGTKATFYELL